MKKRRRDEAEWGISRGMEWNSFHVHAIVLERDFEAVRKGHMSL